MDDGEIEDLDSEGHRDMDYWKGFIIPAIFPFLSLICVILTIDMQITDYPILNKFFGGDDLLIFSLFSLFCSLIAWPIIGFNLPPPQDKGGRASAKFGMGTELQDIYDDLQIHNILVPLDGADHGTWCSIVNEKCLFDLTYDFLMDRQSIEI